MNTDTLTLETELDFEQLASHATAWPFPIRDALSRYVANALTVAGISDKRQRIAVQEELSRLFGDIVDEPLEWSIDEYLATHEVFALDVHTRLDAQGLAATMQSLRDTPPRAVVRGLAERGWDWDFIARCMRTTPDAPDIWAEVTWEDVAAIFGGMDYPTNI